MQIKLAPALLLLAASMAAASPAPAPGGWGDHIKEIIHKKLGKDTHRPDHFTSAYFARATPDQVVNTMNVATPGQPGALGRFNFYVNSNQDKICVRSHRIPSDSAAVYTDMACVL